MPIERAAVLLPLRQEAMRGIPKPPPLFHVRQFATFTGNPATLPRAPRLGSLVMLLIAQPSTTGSPRVNGVTGNGASSLWTAIYSASNGTNQMYTIVWLGVVDVQSPSRTVAVTWTGNGGGIICELVGLEGVSWGTAASASANTITASGQTIVTPYGIDFAWSGSRAALTAAGTPPGYRTIANYNNGTSSYGWLGWRYMTRRAIPAVTFTTSGTTGLNGGRFLMR